MSVIYILYAVHTILQLDKLLDELSVQQLHSVNTMRQLDRQSVQLSHSVNKVLTRENIGRHEKIRL